MIKASFSTTEGKMKLQGCEQGLADANTGNAQEYLPQLTKISIMW